LVRLVRLGIQARVSQVEYEFQLGGNRMLVLPAH
jgi:hypothetical protein